MSCPDMENSQNEKQVPRLLVRAIFDLNMDVITFQA